MKLMKPKVEHLDCTGDPLVVIERAGRTCYKSEDKITDESAPKFVKMLLDRKHHAMIEHASLVFSVSNFLYNRLIALQDPYRDHISLTREAHGCILSGNVRALRDICEDTEVDTHVRNSIAIAAGDVVPMLFTGFLELPLSRKNCMAAIYSGELTQMEQIAHQYFSYRVICDRGVTHEIVRHRPFSYGQESSRYCNYKGGVTFIIPPWMDLCEGDYEVDENVEWFEIDNETVSVDDLNGQTVKWLASLYESESTYQALLEHEGWTPQQARSVLPNSLKTEIIMTANLRRWDHFFTMRCSKYAHPQMQEVANMIWEDMQKRVLWLPDYY